MRRAPPAVLVHLSAAREQDFFRLLRVVMLAEAVNLQRQALIAGLRTEEGDVCVPVVVLRGAARKGVVPLPDKLLCPRSDLSGNTWVGKRRVGDVVGVAAVGLVEQQIQPACQNHKIQQVQ